MGFLELRQARGVHSRVTTGMPILTGVKPLVLYDVYRGVVMDPMQGKLASSQFDFGYTEEFCIPGVTSVSFSSCDSLVGDSLEFNQANRGSLCV